MTILDYGKSRGGILLPIYGPPDERPKKVTVPLRNDVAFPDGAIIAWSGAIGRSREVAESFFRKLGREPEFVEIP